MKKRIADIHSDMVNRQIQKLNCPSEQKIALLDAVIEAASKEKGGQTE